MAQNRNKLIELFIGNIANAVVHKILGIAIDDDNIRSHYSRELNVSLEKSKSYRGKINPMNMALPDKDTGYIRDMIVRKVKAELQLRISAGYENINMGLVETTIENVLRDTNII